MTEQPSLLLAYSCRVCGVDLPYQGVGRPRVYCADCRPSSFPPLTSESDSAQELNGGGSRVVTVREHTRRVKGEESPIPRHRVTDPESSVQASRLAALSAGTLREQCLFALVNAADGLTDFELADRVGRQQTSAGKRRGELVEQGHVEWSGEHRLAPSGANARVWIATPAGREKARSLRNT